MTTKRDQLIESERDEMEDMLYDYYQNTPEIDVIRALFALSEKWDVSDICFPIIQALDDIIEEKVYSGAVEPEEFISLANELIGFIEAEKSTKH